MADDAVPHLDLPIIFPILSVTQVADLIQPFTVAEIETAVMNLHPDKAPPDGFPAYFFSIVLVDYQK